MSERDPHGTSGPARRAADMPAHRVGMGSGGYWLDQPRNVTKLYYSVWVCGLVLVILDLVIHRHDSLAFAEVIGFYAVYGFVACVLLVLAAKGLRRLLKRPEDYYER